MSIPNSISRSLIVYFAGMPITFAYNSYNEAKNAMHKFRNNKLDDYDRKRFDDEESYIKHRIFQESPPNIIMSTIWPIILPISFIPSIIRFMNPPNESSK